MKYKKSQAVMRDEKGRFIKGHKILEGSQKGQFKKGHKINLGRKRLDMIGNKNWDNPNNKFVKGHKLNITTEISLYRKKVKRDNCAICDKKVKINKENLKRKKQQINLDIHHKDENRNNNSIINLLVVCRGCHNLIHNGGIKI